VRFLDCQRSALAHRIFAQATDGRWLAERKTIMADPVGTWHINANGFKGTMNITSNGAGQLGGTIDIDTGVTDTLQGVWSEAAHEIVFDRIRKQGANIVWIQTYTGYLFLTKEPIFGGQGAPEPNPDFRLLTGSFEAIGTGAGPGRARFGWTARQSF
jgi:hypothetical protein